MSMVRFAGSVLKGAAIWAGLATAVLFLVLGALGFLAAAIFMWIAAHLGAAAAAALTALALLLLALLVMAFGALVLSRVRARRPELFADAAGTIAMLTSIAGMLVRQDPKRAILFALIAGALTEYFTTASKPRG